MGLLRAIGSRFKRTEEPTEKELMLDFIGDLREVTSSMDDLLGDLEDEFKVQVENKRSLIQRSLLWLPTPFKPRKLVEQEAKRQKILQVRRKVLILDRALGRMEETIKAVPDTVEENEELLGRRVYEVAFPGEPITNDKLTILEERLAQLEESFFDALSEMHSQIGTVHEGMQQLSQTLQEHGMKLDRIETKVDQVDSRLQATQKKLVEISKKLTQNKTLLAILAGAVIALAVLLII